MMGGIIAFSGAHGTGKTTAAHALAVKLKLERPEWRIGFLSEVARECPFPINRNGSACGQLWMFGRQMSVELELAEKNDMVVSDRCLLDYVAYAYALDLPVASRLEKVCMTYVRDLRIYDEIRLLPPQKTFLVADGVRDTDLEWRKRVHNTLVTLHKRCGGPVVWPEGDENGSV